MFWILEDQELEPQFETIKVILILVSILINSNLF